jgi:hypothetical protein
MYWRQSRRAILQKTHFVRFLLHYTFETVAISLCVGWHGQRGMCKGGVKHWCGGCDDARRLTRRRRLHPPAGAPLCLSFRLIPVLSPTCHIFYCVFWLLVGLASLLATRSKHHTSRLKLRGELLWYTRSASERITKFRMSSGFFNLVFSRVF